MIARRRYELFENAIFFLCGGGITVSDRTRQFLRVACVILLFIMPPGEGASWLHASHQ